MSLFSAINKVIHLTAPGKALSGVQKVVQGKHRPGYLEKNYKQRNTSLASASSLSVLDPIGILSEDLRNYEHIDTIMQLNLDVLAGYILRAIPFLSDHTRGDVVDVLTQIHPSKQFGFENKVIGMDESEYEFGLPMYDGEAISSLYGTKKPISHTLNRGGYGSHSYGGKPTRHTSHTPSGNTSLHGTRRPKPRNTGGYGNYSHGGKATRHNPPPAPKVPSHIRRAALMGQDVRGGKIIRDFSIGKTLSIDIPLGNTSSESVKIYLNIVATAVQTPTKVLKDIAKGADPERGWYGRWHKFTQGSVGVVDLVTQADTIAEDRKNARADKTGVMHEIRKRNAKGKVAVAFGGKMRYGVGSNFLVMSLDVAEEVARSARVNLGNYYQRQKFMGAFSCLIMVVVDREDDYLIIYYRDIRMPSQVSVKQAGAYLGGSNDNAHLEEIMLALSQKSTPSL